MRTLRKKIPNLPPSKVFRCTGTLRMREGHTYIIIGPEQSAKVLSVVLYRNAKVSPSKVFRYTVHVVGHYQVSESSVVLSIIIGIAMVVFALYYWHYGKTEISVLSFIFHSI